MCGTLARLFALIAMNHLDWALAVSNKRLRPSSLGVYRSMWAGLERRLREQGAPGPTLCDAQALGTALRGSGDYGTQRRVFRLVQWVCETLSEAGHPVSDACTGLEALYRADVRPVREVRAVSGAEDMLSVLVERSELSAHLVALAAVCELTGLKTGQLRQLRRSDVTFSGGAPQLTLRTRREDRRWPLPETTVRALQAWLAVHPCSSEQAAFFATDASGAPPAPSTLWRQLKRVSEVLGEGGPRTGTGQFRAKLASRLQHDGASLEDVRRALGHRQLESTQELLGRVRVRRRSRGADEEGGGSSL